MREKLSNVEINVTNADVLQRSDLISGERSGQLPIFACVRMCRNAFTTA